MSDTSETPILTFFKDLINAPLLQRPRGDEVPLYHLVVILQIQAFPQRPTFGELYDALGLGKSRLSRTLTIMEKNGHIRCVRFKDDRRTFYIDLTPRGRRAVFEVGWKFFEAAQKIVEAGAPVPPDV